MVQAEQLAMIAARGSDCWQRVAELGTPEYAIRWEAGEGARGCRMPSKDCF